MKISLLMPASPEVMKPLETLNRVAEESFEKHGPNGGTSPLMASWRCMSLALMAYRQDFTPTAKEWCRKSFGYRVDVPARNATAHLISAMVSHKLGEWDQARSELELGRALVEKEFADGLGIGNGAQGWWYDWLFARVLLREAEGMIEQRGAMS